MAAAFHSSIVGKVLFVVAATIVALLFSTGYAGEAPPPPEFKYPPCQTLALPLPECQRYCKDIGFQHGGFIKGDDVCCCNS